MAAKLEFLPEAIDEAAAARQWYAERSKRAASRFMAELDRAVERILDAPDRWPAHVRDTRFYRLRRFPYLVVDHVAGETVTVIAVAHGRRRPGYWKNRLPS
jgi:plasmid stabilization system protein ParE